MGSSPSEHRLFNDVAPLFFLLSRRRYVSFNDRRHIGDEVPEASETKEVRRLLDRLHRPKDKAYGDAWRKRGEVLSIFSNIARKYDRLCIALTEDAPSRAENLTDTVADLAVYSAKYLTWLAEKDPVGFSDYSQDLNAGEASARQGADAVTAVLDHLPRWAQGAKATRLSSTEQAWSEIQTSFEGLERLLMAQSEGGVTPKTSDKVRFTWHLLYADVWLLVGLIEMDPGNLTSLLETIEPMEGSS